MAGYVLTEEFDKRWVCEVVRSGFHNGAGCSPLDPHDESVWQCAYRYELSIKDGSLNAKRLGFE